jgi:hypothetical protein
LDDTLVLASRAWMPEIIADLAHWFEFETNIDPLRIQLFYTFYKNLTAIKYHVLLSHITTSHFRLQHAHRRSFLGGSF